MDSVEALRLALTSSGCSPYGAQVHVESLVLHACVCRTRADTTTAGGFRELVSYTCDMTRKDMGVDNLRRDFTTAACEALFDLIMEGV